MKFITVPLLFFITFSSYPQADLDLTLTFITDYPEVWILNFGLDSTATNGIDPFLGEYVYPPDACGGPGWTCIAFKLPPPLFDHIGPRDYRYGVLPYSGQVEHRLGIGFGFNTTQAELFWDFPNGVSVHLEDVLGGQFFELDMQAAGSFVLTDSLLFWYLNIIMVVTYNNVIPVELTSFTASILQNEKVVQLNWTTATETNNSGFEIQRTSPLPSPYQGEGGEAGRGWERIGFVPGFGTTTEPKSYSFIDEDVSTGSYKYRLKQIDFDGTFTYSNEIEVEVDFTPEEFVLYQNYPNPFNPKTVISYQLPVNGNVTLIVYDILGNEVATLVNEEKQPGVYEVEFDGTNLSSGVYYYVMRAGNPSTGSGQSFIDTKKFVLIR